MFSSPMTRLGTTHVTASLIWLLIAFSGGCVDIDGGAVELSWGIRDFAGEKSECRLAGLKDVRICWQPLGDAGTAEQICESTDPPGSPGFEDFRCENSRGSTPFVIATGPTSFFVRLRCQDDLLASGPFQTPPPIVREVKAGEVVTLSQILIVASNENCVGDACTCPTE